MAASSAVSTTCGFILFLGSIHSAAPQTPGADSTFPDQETAEETIDVPSPAQPGASAALRIRAIAGSPLYRDTKLYQRLEVHPSPDLTLFGLTEKDPGEVAVADFVTFHARWSASSTRDFVFGDLRPGFARGLVFSRSPGRDGSGMPSIRRDSRYLGHRSSSENAAFRGAATRIGRSGGTELLLLAGLGRRDARLDESGTARSLPESGLHVTESERHRKRALRSSVSALRLRRIGASRSIGITVQGMRHDRSVDLRQPGKVAHGFVGRSRQTLGIDGTIGRTRRGQISLEAAVDDRREWALEAAGRLPVGRSRLGGLLQMTSPSFFSLFGAQSGSAGGNKRRVLLVAAGRSGGSSWKLHAEQVVRQSPTLTNPLSALRQVWGLEAGRLIHKRARFTCALQKRSSSRWRASSGPYVVQQVRGRFDLALGHFVSGERGRWTTSARLRLEGTRVREAIRSLEPETAEDGLATSISVKGAVPSGFEYALLVSRFRTASYGARVYEYEWDLPGTISVRPLFGNGWRAVALTRWRWSGIGFALRYRWYRDRTRTAYLLGFQVETTAKRISRSVDTPGKPG